jgi:hypothetical protein
MMHDQDGCTALMNASENAKYECVRLLLESGADTSAKSSKVCMHMRMRRHLSLRSCSISRFNNNSIVSSNASRFINVDL